MFQKKLFLFLFYFLIKKTEMVIVLSESPCTYLNKNFRLSAFILVDFECVPCIHFFWTIEKERCYFCNLLIALRCSLLTTFEKLNGEEIKCLTSSVLEPKLWLMIRFNTHTSVKITQWTNTHKQTKSSLCHVCLRCVYLLYFDARTRKDCSDKI